MSDGCMSDDACMSGDLSERIPFLLYKTKKIGTACRVALRARTAVCWVSLGRVSDFLLHSVTKDEQHIAVYIDGKYNGSQRRAQSSTFS